MDSQHRHELETNSLAKHLAKTGERLRPYQQAIVIGVIAVVALVVIGSMISRAGSGSDAGWQAFAAATQMRNVDFDALESTAKAHAGKPVGEMARITWADGRLQRGMTVYFSDKRESQDAIAEAKEAYEVLLGAESPIIVQRAKFGLARVAEADGSLQEAVKAYKAIDSGPFQTIAASRAKQLEELPSPDELKWLVSAKAVGGGLPAGFGDMPESRPDDIALPDDELTPSEVLSDIFNRYENAQLPMEDGSETPSDDSESSDNPSTNDSDGNVPANPEPTDEPSASESEAGSTAQEVESEDVDEVEAVDDSPEASAESSDPPANDDEQ